MRNECIMGSKFLSGIPWPKKIDSFSFQWKRIKRLFVGQIGFLWFSINGSLAWIRRNSAFFICKVVVIGTQPSARSVVSIRELTSGCLSIRKNTGKNLEGRICRYGRSISNSDSGFTPSLCLEPLAKHKKVTTIETWLSSFHVFVGAYTKQFPHEAPALMKYGEIIQDLAGRGHNWKFYDENAVPLFRGIECMASCSLSHKFPFVDHSKTQLIHQKERQILSQKDIVLNSIRTASVFLVVLLSTFATGVRGHTQFQNVVFVAHHKLPVLSPDLPSPPHRHSSLPTPVKVERLGFLLGLHPFHYWIFVIWFYSRFSGSLSRWRKSRTATNLMSALDKPEAVDAKLQKELEVHRLAGPFQSPPLSPFLISPLGLVPKKVQGEFRLIHHLSFPTGFSVNDAFLQIIPVLNMLQLMRPSNWFKVLVQVVFWPRQMFKMHSGLSPFILMIMVSLGCSGGGSIIMTDAWLLKCLAQLWNGLLVIREKLNWWLPLSFFWATLSTTAGFVFVTLLLPGYSHSTRKDLWSLHYHVVCGYWIRLHFFGGSSTSW